jgi:hypothetical protein
MSLYYLLTHFLLYFVSIGALIVLFGAVLAVLVRLLLKVRRLVIQLLGGTIEE